MNDKTKQCMKRWFIRLMKEQRKCDHQNCEQLSTSSDLNKSKYWCWNHEPQELMAARFTDMSDYEWKSEVINNDLLQRLR